MRWVARSRLREERGTILVAALGLLMALIVLTAGVVLFSTTLDLHSGRDNYSKQALGAAEAGLQIARYRINRMNPANQGTSSCPPTSSGSSGTATGTPPECAAVSVNLGNGASATYYVSAAYTTAPPCGSGAPASNHWARCVVSQGTAHGVTRRVASRVDASVVVGAPIACASCSFVGLNGIKLDGSNTVNAYLESDGPILLKGSGDNITGCAPSPTGSVTTNGNSCPLLSPAATNSWASQVPSPSTINSNGINSGASGLGLTDTCTTTYSWDTTLVTKDGSHPCGNSNSGFSSGYTASTRVESLGANTTITICSVNTVCAYNLCSLSMAAGGTINLASGSRVLIFIDSPYRTGSGCATGTGNVLQNAGSSFNNSGIPSNLQVFAWGQPGATSTPNSSIGMMAASGLNAFIYAPNSVFSNPSASASINGTLIAYSIGGADVSLSFNANSTSNPSTGLPQTGLFTATGGTWHECTASATTGDPMSGC